MVFAGVDLIEIERVANAKARFGDGFLRRVFTPRELDDCRSRAESLAGRFAAKEAAAKALGTGVWRHGIGWTDIEVVRDPVSHAPALVMHGAARRRAGELGWTSWSLSLSHDRGRALAFVVALAQSTP